MNHKTYNSQLSHRTVRNDLFEAAKWVPLMMEEIMTQERGKLSLGPIMPCVSLVGSMHPSSSYHFIIHAPSGHAACVGNAALGNVLGKHN